MATEVFIEEGKQPGTYDLITQEVKPFKSVRDLIYGINRERLLRRAQLAVGITSTTVGVLKLILADTMISVVTNIYLNSNPDSQVPTTSYETFLRPPDLTMVNLNTLTDAGAIVGGVFIAYSAIMNLRRLSFAQQDANSILKQTS